MKNIFILIFIFSFTSIAMGQRTKSDDVEVIEFGDDSSSRSRSSKKKVNNLSYIIIKTNPLSNIFGKQYIEVEKPIKDFFSLEAGVGLSFPAVIDLSILSTDYLDFGSDFCESEIWVNSDQDDYSDTGPCRDNSVRNTNIGIYTSLAFKFYFYNEAPQDSYISFVTKYRRNNYEVQKIEATNGGFNRLINEYDQEYANNLDFTVRYGYQTLYKKLAADWFIGIGIRRIQESRQDIGQDLTGYQAPLSETVSSNLLLELGVKVGFHIGG